MPQLIKIETPFSKLFLRINREKNIIEVSETNGKTWSSRFTNQNCGTFADLLFYKGNVFACTDKGLFVSSNDGKTFSSRYTNASTGQFFSLQDGGKELLATTSKGLFWSINEGRTWTKR